MSKAITSASVKIRVPFHDIDIMQVAWHGHYVKYFEIARGELLDSIDYNFIQMKESGFFWPVIDMRVKFIKPARLGTVLDVQAKLVEYENRLKIDFLINDTESNQLLTKGYTIQAAVDAQSGELCLTSPRILLSKLGLS